MNDVDEYKEVCHLLKIWFYLKENNTTWPAVLHALETRINNLLGE